MKNKEKKKQNRDKLRNTWNVYKAVMKCFLHLQSGRFLSYMNIDSLLGTPQILLEQDF